MARTRRTSSMSVGSMYDKTNGSFTSKEGVRSRQHCPSTSSGPVMDGIPEVLSPASSVWTVATSLNDISVYQPDEDSGVYSGVVNPVGGREIVGENGHLENDHVDNSTELENANEDNQVSHGDKTRLTRKHTPVVMTHSMELHEDKVEMEDITHQ